MRERVVSRDEWTTARVALLAQEKELTRLHDAISRQRRELPWVRIDKDYRFEGPQGKQTLSDLLEEAGAGSSLPVMFDPGWSEWKPAARSAIVTGSNAGWRSEYVLSPRRSPSAIWISVYRFNPTSIDFTDERTLLTSAPQFAPPPCLRRTSVSPIRATPDLTDNAPTN